MTALHPCADCAKLIIQAGIRAVYAPIMPPNASPDWHAARATAAMLFQEAGVRVIEYQTVWPWRAADAA